jgi:hypothetical protein
MGITYNDLLWCENHKDECPAHVRVIIETTELAYGARNPSHGSCPPGNEPPPYQGVVAAAVNASDSETWIDLDADEKIHIERYVLERYEEAHTAWRARYAFCGWQEPAPSQPPATPPQAPPGFPPSKPPAGGDKPLKPVKSDPLAIVLLFVGLGIYTSRARRKTK